MNVLRTLSELKRNPRVLQSFRMVGLGLTGISFVLVLWQSLNQGIMGDLQVFLTASVASFAAYGVSFVLQATAWCLLIAGFARVKVGWKDLEIFAYSNILRRTPGAIWYLLERVERYNHQGTGTRITLGVSVAEWFLFLLAGVLVYILFSLDQIEAYFLTGGITILVVFVSLHFIAGEGKRTDTANHFAFGIGLGKLKTTVLSLSGILIALIIYAVCYIIGGLIIYELVQVLHPVNAFLLPDAIRMWTFVGGTALFASVVIPMNIGLRDFTLSGALLMVISLNNAITVAAEVRLIFAVADIVCSFGLWYLSKWVLAHKVARKDCSKVEILAREKD